MANMDAWDMVLLVAGAYLAVTVLVRLMRNHRDKVVAQVQQEWLAEQARKKEKETLEQRRKAREGKKRKEGERRHRGTTEAA